MLGLVLICSSIIFENSFWFLLFLVKLISYNLIWYVFLEGRPVLFIGGLLVFMNTFIIMIRMASYWMSNCIGPSTLWLSTWIFLILHSYRITYLLIMMKDISMENHKTAFTRLSISQMWLFIQHETCSELKFWLKYMFTSSFIWL